MQRPQLQSVWNECLVLLKNETTTSSYENWIKKLVPFAEREGVFYILMDDPYNRPMLNRRYGALIGQALTRVAGLNMRCEILIPQEAEALLAWESGSEETEPADSSAPKDPEPMAVEDRHSPDILPSTPGIQSSLNPKYTFSTFVVGPSNRFAHAAAVAVAQSPARAYNPLFIYGGVGLGKTHLMHAIGHMVMEENPAAKIVYISSENFTNELITAIKDNRNNANSQFRQKYRNVDMLMIDDIQFIAGRESTQEEFFHTFNTLYESGKQIILTSDKQPREIPKLEERLRSRFEWGLITDVQKPDYETRIAILKRKAELEALLVPDEVCLYIAERVESNIRELEGALTRAEAYARMERRDLNVEIVQEALNEILIKKEKRSITCDYIMQVVGEYYGISLEDLKGKKRTQSVAHPRQVAMALARELTDMSLPRIGGEFGRDHSTVSHACDAIKDRLSDSTFRAQWRDLKKRIAE